VVGVSPYPSGGIWVRGLRMSSSSSLFPLLESVNLDK
jgi:hypothetical protein